MWRSSGSRRGALVLFVVASLVMLTVLDCTFAPPIRSTHYGIPGKLQAGRIEVGGCAYPGPIGAAFVALSLSDLVQLEAGSNLSPSWALGFAGLRLTLDRPLDGKGFAADLEFGAGAGVGGEFYDYDDVSSVKWFDRFAYGGYLGAGLGNHLNENGGGFLRARVQVSKADLIPTTVWGSLLGGVQMTAHDLVNMSFGIGFGGYGNAEEGVAPIFLIEFGLSIEFEIFTYERPEPPPEKEEDEDEDEEKEVAVESIEDIEDVEDVEGTEVKKEVAERKQEESPPAVAHEIHKDPCPSGAAVHGSPPPKGFEVYCAGEDRVRNGWYIGFYEDGQKASEGVYTYGARDGEWVFYYSNGKIRLQAGYRKGKKHGRWVFRDRDGVEIRVVEYADDLELKKE
jgi:hypothetical protein